MKKLPERSQVDNRLKRLVTYGKEACADNEGMTFAEVLIAVMILMLVSVGMISIIGFGSQQYDKTIRESQALVLCSTISTVLEYELSYTTQIHAESDGVLKEFMSPDYAIEGSLSSIMTDHSGSNGYGRILLGNSADQTEYKELLPDSAYMHGLLAKVTDVTYDQTTHYTTLTVSVGYQGKEKISRTFQVKNRNADINR